MNINTTKSSMKPQSEYNNINRVVVETNISLYKEILYGKTLFCTIHILYYKRIFGKIYGENVSNRKQFN